MFINLVLCSIFQLPTQLPDDKIMLLKEHSPIYFLGLELRLKETSRFQSRRKAEIRSVFRTCALTSAVNFMASFIPATSQIKTVSGWLEKESHKEIENSRERGQKWNK